LAPNVLFVKFTLCPVGFVQPFATVRTLDFVTNEESNGRSRESEVVDP